MESQLTVYYSYTSDLEFERLSKRCKAGIFESVQTICNCSCDAIDFRAYRLKNQSSQYDNTVYINFTNLATPMITQLKSHIFYPAVSISRSKSFYNFMFASEANCEPERASAVLFFSLSKKSASRVLPMRLACDDKVQIRIPFIGNSTTSFTYPPVKRYSLQTYNMNENIADTEDQKPFLASETQELFQNSKELVNQTALMRR